MRIQIIAEIGWNHMGDMNLAKEMIAAASESGASYAKFQTWSVANLKNGPWDKDGRREIYEKAELSPEQHVELSIYCKSIDISFLTSIFNYKDVEWIRNLSMDTIKIPSHEVHNNKLISKVDGDFVLFHCVSAYPAPAKNINLPRINELSKLSKYTGYSGHFFGIDDAIASLNFGVSFIEKHFTIDRNLPGRDNKFAILPVDMQILSNYCKNFEIMKNNLGIEMQSIESETYEIYRGRWSSNI